MARHCPVCGQVLPTGLDEHTIDQRVRKLAAPALSEERRVLEREFNDRLERQRERLKKEAEKGVQQELFAANKRAATAEKLQNSDRKWYEEQTAKQAQQARKLAQKDAQLDIRKVEEARQKDRTRFEMDRHKFQQQLDAMSRKLEKQTGEQLGEEGELDLLTELRKAFQKDRIERIGRGTKGADIVQEVTEDSKIVGRIIYESKNVSTWSNKFISQAKAYQSQYDTPNVLIVSRAFPQKKKGLCILKGIPIVELRLAVSLASVMREGIVAIANLRLSSVARDEKAQELFDYIISDKFVTRFRDVGEHVASLRERQQKERDWHENSWQEQERLYGQIDSRRREIDSQIKTITRGVSEKKPLRMAARA